MYLLSTFLHHTRTSPYRAPVIEEASTETLHGPDLQAPNFPPCAMGEADYRMKKAFLGCCIRELVDIYPWAAERKVESVSRVTRVALEMPRRSIVDLASQQPEHGAEKQQEKISSRCGSAFIVAVSTTAEPHPIVSFQALSTSTWPGA
jgi:hypothetical protein